ncbi:MAG TPA: molybdenum ABC transporter ATP-binding protein [Casimicrobiaceae bacterium]|nr:molybdenum ABC transporter ATP-binding protein [Casimicrobiaceae bacterium]
MIDVDIEHTLGAFAMRARFAVERPVVGVFGRSGAGKTSLVNAIAGVIRPRRGRVRVNDEVWLDTERGIDVPSHKRRVGYVFQDALLFPHLSVEGNLFYGHRLRQADERFIDAPKVIELLGLGSLLDRNPRALSGGEKQRVAIGRALLAQPRLLLLDEPLASLDVPRKTEILDYVERLRDTLHIPILYVSHSVPEITRLADVIVVMSDGECLAVGDVEEVMGRLDLKPHTGRYEAGSVIDTTVRAHDHDAQLTTLAFAGGELVVPLLDANPASRVRARVRARDVSIATTRPANISIQNVLRSRIVAIRDEPGAVIDVQLAVGEATLLARITQRSRQALGLHVGQEVYALIKAISFDHRSTGYS